MTQNGSFMERPILIADDDAQIRMLVGTALTRAGFTCEFAEAGDIAIEKLEQKEYALVLLDLMMPGRDGHGVIDHMRFSGKSVPIVVMTAAGRSRVEALSPLRVKAVLLKPFEIQELVDVVRGLVRGGSSLAE
jgi:DNA-binding response OmpR family regulator